MEQTVNSFLKGLQCDVDPMMLGNDVLTDCLNGTIITTAGNEPTLLNDMGNRKIDSAFLPEGYEPVGIKEYGGIIYIASYNPITNKGLIGSFPSPERKINPNDDQDLSINLNLSIPTKLETLRETFGIDNNTKLTFLDTDTKILVFSDKCPLHSGDKYILYGDLSELYTSKDKKYDSLISNFYNTKAIYATISSKPVAVLDVLGDKERVLDAFEEVSHRAQVDGGQEINIPNSLNLSNLKYTLFANEEKILSPKNNLFTLSVGVLNPQNQFVDITNKLVRWDNSTLMQLEDKTDEYVKNAGYFIKDLKDDNSFNNLIDSDDLLVDRNIIPANTYVNKLVGPLCLKTEINHFQNVNYSVQFYYSPSDNEAIKKFTEKSILENYLDIASESSSDETSNSVVKEIIQTEKYYDTHTLYNLDYFDCYDLINPSTGEVLDYKVLKTRVVDCTYNEETNLYTTKLSRLYITYIKDKNQLYEYIIAPKLLNNNGKSFKESSSRPQYYTGDMSKADNLYLIVNTEFTYNSPDFNPTSLKSLNSTNETTIYLKNLCSYGVIDLSKMNSGKFTINSWRFYSTFKDDDSYDGTNLLFGYTFYGKNDNYNYGGIFIEVEDSNIEDICIVKQGKLVTSGYGLISLPLPGLEPRKLYWVKVYYRYKKEGDSDFSEVVVGDNYWIMTTTLFNDVYNSGSVQNYCEPKGDAEDIVNNLLTVDFDFAYTINSKIDPTFVTCKYSGKPFLASREYEEGKYKLNQKDFTFSFDYEFYTEIEVKDLKIVIDKNKYPDFVTPKNSFNYNFVESSNKAEYNNNDAKCKHSLSFDSNTTVKITSNVSKYWRGDEYEKKLIKIANPFFYLYNIPTSLFDFSSLVRDNDYIEFTWSWCDNPTAAYTAILKWHSTGEGAHVRRLLGNTKYFTGGSIYWATDLNRTIEGGDNMYNWINTQFNNAYGNSSVTHVYGFYGGNIMASNSAPIKTPIPRWYFDTYIGNYKCDGKFDAIPTGTALDDMRNSGTDKVALVWMKIYNKSGNPKWVPIGTIYKDDDIKTIDNRFSTLSYSVIFCPQKEFNISLDYYVPKLESGIYTSTNLNSFTSNPVEFSVSLKNYLNISGNNNDLLKVKDNANKTISINGLLFNFPNDDKRYDNLISKFLNSNSIIDVDNMFIGEEDQNWETETLPVYLDDKGNTLDVLKFYFKNYGGSFVEYESDVIWQFWNTKNHRGNVISEYISFKNTKVDVKITSFIEFADDNKARIKFKVAQDSPNDLVIAPLKNYNNVIMCLEPLGSKGIHCYGANTNDCYQKSAYILQSLMVSS